MVATIEVPQNTSKPVKLLKQKPGSIAKHWKKGVCVNPGGRPKGFAALVRERTKHGVELVEIALKVMRGSLTVERVSYDADGNEKITKERPAIKDRLVALQWLADRGWGKAQETISLQNPDGSNLISPDLLQAAALLAKGLSEAGTVTEVEIVPEPGQDALKALPEPDIKPE